MDPSRNVVLEASAGTGKTSVLVGRYLNLLRAGVAPSNILALTFTRKAATEMRERIVAELRKAAASSTADRRLWQALRERSGDIAIGTIDAFCLSLLREFPLEAGLDPGFSMVDQTEVLRLVDQALDRTVAIGRGLVEDDADLALVFTRLAPGQIRAGLAHLLDRRLVSPAALERIVGQAPAGLSAESACRSALDRLRVLLEREPGLGRFIDDGPLRHPGFQAFAADLRHLDAAAAGGCASMRRILDTARAYFLTARGTPRTRLTGYRQAQCVSRSAWQRHVASVAAIAPDVAELIARLDRQLNLVLARGVRRLLAILMAEYGRTLERHGAIDFSEALLRALALLSQMDEFAQSRYRLESRYHHVLVDEFQDTSRAQWQLLSLLVQSWGEGLGLVQDAPVPPSIFVVGDRKQSIYRFRDAEVAVLEEAGRRIQVLRPGGSVRRSISTSFRAVPRLLAFVNDLFGSMDAGTSRPDAFRYGPDDRFPSAGHAETDGTDADVLGLVADRSASRCADAIADEIVRLLEHATVRDRATGARRPARAGDVAILFRTRESHRVIEEALETRDVPAYVYKGLGFFDTDEIKDLIALLRYLARPDSDLHAAALLRSRFVRLSDPGLQTLAPHVAESLGSPARPVVMARLGDEDRAVMELARRSVQRWLPLVDRLPAVELLEQVLADAAYAFELGGPRRAQARENLKKLRELVRRMQNRGYATLAHIADRLDRLSTGDEANAVIDALDSVSLMTVHAAKGLEFPIVFLVNLGRGTGGGSMPIRVTAGADEREPSVSIGTPVEADEEERLREREETKRLFYVGVTRARDRLYLSAVLAGDRPAPSRGSLAEVMPADLWQLFRDVVDGPDDRVQIDWRAGETALHGFRICRAGETPSSTRQRPPPTRETAPDDFGVLAPAPHMKRLAATERAAEAVGWTADGGSGSDGRADADRVLGIVVHRLLQLAPEHTESRGEVLERAAAQLREAEGSPQDDLEIRAATAADAYRAIVDAAEVSRLLAGGARLHEVPFSMRVDSETSRIVRGTIDCLVVRPDGRVIVLEFKTGRARPLHDAQLRIYVEAARRLFPGSEAIGYTVYGEAGGRVRVESLDPDDPGNRASRPTV